MLAKPAAMPARSSSYAYEPKWDGFRAMLSSEHGLRVISRRRWNMTPLLPELEAFPAKGVFDGELIAFSEGQPDFVPRSATGCCSDRNARFRSLRRLRRTQPRGHERPSSGSTNLPEREHVTLSVLTPSLGPSIQPAVTPLRSGGKRG